MIGVAEKIILLTQKTDETQKRKVPITIGGVTTEIEASPVVDVKIREFTAPEEIQEIKNKFEIIEDACGHLMCVGSYFFDCIDKEGNNTRIEYLGFGHIRIEKKFKNDAKLKKPLELLSWLDSMGVSEPLNNWLKDN